MTEQLHERANERQDLKGLERAGQDENERLDRGRQEALEQRSPVENLTERQHEAESLAKTTEHEPRQASAETLNDAPKQPAHQPRSRKAAFNAEMSRVQSQMGASSRTFSKVIHAPVIEKASESIGATVARPNALLAGSLAAFLLTGCLYMWARYAGYPLSGFESIGAFIIGWLVGIIFDYTRIMVTGKR